MVHSMRPNHLIYQPEVFQVCWFNVFPDSALQQKFRVPRNAKYDGGFGSPIRYVSGNNVTVNIMIKSRCWTSTYEWTE